MIKIECKVQVIDWENAATATTNKTPTVVVRNHWNNDNRVVLKIDDGPEVTVIGRDLITAIENAMRTNRF